jgi:hypothetical protein
MNLPDTFAAPYVEIIDGQEVTFPLMTMEDWAQCCNVLKANRRQELEKKLVANAALTAAEREQLLLQVERELVPLSYACAYRTEVPQGIRSTLLKSLLVSGKNEADAKVLIAKIPPVRQQHIAKMIADPPIADPNKKPIAEKNDEAATSETGSSTPDLSESSGASTPDA